jgi:UDP-N-acetyl-D-mannosaminuronic acid dehydrogenase
MPEVLSIKPEEVDNNVKRSKYTVTVIGCCRKGINYANALADVGFKVICTDDDPSVVKRVAKGKTPCSEPEAEVKLKRHIKTEQIRATGEVKKAVSQSDIIIMAYTAKVDEQKNIDYSQIVNSFKQTGAALHKGALVICGSVVRFGFIEGTVKEILENTSGLKVGQDLGLAYKPIFTQGDLSSNLELSVAAADKTSLEAATVILKTIAKNVKQIGDIKTAEAAALFNIAKEDAEMALANEMSVFCEAASVDYFEVLKHLGLGESSFCPLIVEGGKNDEVYLLLESAENLNAKLRLSTLARQINENMVKHAVNLTQEALRACNKTLRRARVAVLGPTNQTSAAAVLVKMLETKGAKVSVYDPNARRDHLDSIIVKSSLNEAAEGADCIIVLSGQEHLSLLNLKKLKALMKAPSTIVDLVGKFDPKQVEIEGFIYRGLGRA